VDPANPDSDATFKEVSAPTPDPDPVSDPATLVSASRKLRCIVYSVYYNNVFVFGKKRFVFILIVHLVEKMLNLSEKFCFKFILSKGYPDPK
jgi:hypothetical protein